MDKLFTIETNDWQTHFQQAQQDGAVDALEKGQVLYFPKLAFDLSDIERHLSSPRYVDPRRKNINFNPNNQQLGGTLCVAEDRQRLKQLLERYATQTKQLMGNLLSHYTPHIALGRTSLRPVEAKGRRSSAKKDDTRLHVDAFPATPMGDQRILRVFSNTNHEGQPRVWELGEPFQAVANRFFPKAMAPIIGSRRLLKALKITKSYRSTYDHYMLQIHDKMKLNQDYQRECDKFRFSFPPGSSWIVYTDLVSHAALSGQHLMEQTFYLPHEKMKHIDLAPQSVLQKLAGDRALL